MEDRFRLKVFQTYVVDDYERGETGKTFENLIDDRETFKTPEETLLHFVDCYGSGLVYRSVDSDGSVEYRMSEIMAGDDYGFREPTAEEKELWKLGRKTLYNVEWTGHIVRESLVNEINTNALPFKILDA